MGRSLTAAPASTENIQAIINGIEGMVNISVFTLLSPLLVIVLAVRRTPVIPSLAAGIVSAGIFAALIQPDAGISSFCQRCRMARFSQPILKPLKRF